MLFKVLLAVTTVSHALVVGSLFAFSTFIMSALARIDTAGVRAMQSINVVILRSPFIALFLLSTVLSILLPVYAWFGGERQSVVPLAASGALYFVGLFVVTMAFNVPLNNRLEAAAPQDLTSIWAEYLRSWTAWNHVRSFAGIASILALIWCALNRFGS
jgi:uncharacterized membrane protein